MKNINLSIVISCLLALFLFGSKEGKAQKWQFDFSEDIAWSGDTILFVGMNSGLVNPSQNFEIFLVNEQGILKEQYIFKWSELISGEFAIPKNLESGIYRLFMSNSQLIRRIVVFNSQQLSELNEWILDEEEKEQLHEPIRETKEEYVIKLKNGISPSEIGSKKEVQFYCLNQSDERAEGNYSVSIRELNSEIFTDESFDVMSKAIDTNELQWTRTFAVEKGQMELPKEVQIQQFDSKGNCSIRKMTIDNNQFSASNDSFDGMNQLFFDFVSSDSIPCDAKIKSLNSVGEFGVDKMNKKAIIERYQKGIKAAFLNMQIKKMMDLEMPSTYENLFEEFAAKTASNEVFLSEYKPFNTFREVIKEIVPFVRIVSSKKKNRFKMVDLQNFSAYAKEPLVLLNGRVFSDINALLKIDPRAIHKISVYNELVRIRPFGEIGKNGILSIQLNSDIEFEISGFEDKRIVWNGYGNTDRIIEAGSKKIDRLNSLIYWNSNVNNKAGNFYAFQYENPKKLAWFVLTIQGVLNNGELVKKQFLFKTVKKLIP